MSSSLNQIEALVLLQKSKCGKIWAQHGLSISEQHEKLEEFKKTLMSTCDDFYNHQINEAAQLEDEINNIQVQISTQRARLGTTTPLPPFSGTLKEQYGQNNELYQEVLEKVKQREKEIFALSKDIRVLSTQLLEPIPANCNIDVTNSTCDLSYGFVNSLKQTEAELRSIVQRNISLVRESLPFLVYYLKEMNLYDELSFIFSHCDQWEEQGEFIQSHHSIIGPDVYRTLHNGQQYTYSHFDRVIQSKLNMALIPSVRDLPPPQPQSTKTRHSIMDTNLNPDTDYIFDHYALDYSQFPVDVPFVQELQQKVLLLQTMYRERADFALNIGDKIRNLWELTETSTDESQAWMERCQDLSMLNLRHFQLELIRLCDKKMELLPKWVNNHEEMIRLICSKLGTSDFEIEEKLQLCRQQMTLDDHLQSLRLELTQLRANLAVRQPILDKITAFKSACEAVDNVKKLQDDPNRFKDSKLRTQLDKLRRERTILPQKAAELYKDILKFEDSHGELYNSGQRVLSVLEQNEFFEEARKKGFIALPKRKVNLDKTSPMSTTSAVAAMIAPPVSRLKAAHTTQLNQTKVVGKTAPGNVSRGAAKPVIGQRRLSKEIPGGRPGIPSAANRLQK